MLTIDDLKIFNRESLFDFINGMIDYAAERENRGEFYSGYKLAFEHMKDYAETCGYKSSDFELKVK